MEATKLEISLIEVEESLDGCHKLSNVFFQINASVIWRRYLRYFQINPMRSDIKSQFKK